MSMLNHNSAAFPRLCSNSNLGKSGINKKIGTEDLLIALAEEEDFWPFCNFFEFYVLSLTVNGILLLTF